MGKIRKGRNNSFPLLHRPQAAAFILYILRVIVDMYLVLQLPKHVGRLLFHVFQDGNLVGQIVDGRNLRHQRVYLLFEVVVHCMIIDKCCSSCLACTRINGEMGKIVSLITIFLSKNKAASFAKSSRLRNSFIPCPLSLGLTFSNWLQKYKEYLNIDFFCVFLQSKTLC